MSPNVTDLLERYRRKGWKIAAAESCTGGLIGATLTEIPGSSDVFDRGFITYSNQAKTELMGVSADLISRLGAVSFEVAVAMVDGALAKSHADVAVAVTGIAGPGGGSAAKPVGLVFVGIGRRGLASRAERHQFPGNRAEIRSQAVARALALLEVEVA